MKKNNCFLLIPFFFCSWCLCSYVLQPYPANIIALILILSLSFHACHNPANGLLVAVFFTPLTISLGHHLKVYLDGSAPSYMAYAEIVLLATLFGWVMRMALNRYNPDRFVIAHKERTDIENCFLWIMGLWAGMSVIGVAPALYRNLETSPIIPFNLLAVKVGFAPVWGHGDEFFPITMAINTLLAYWFVYYVQQLIRQEELFVKLRNTFLASITLTAIYGIIQFAFEVGYTKGKFSNYNLSTFQDNESFATFNFLAFMVVLPLFFSFKKKR